MRIGDVSRHRRFADPARLRWYAYHRTIRFALRMGQDGAPEQAFSNRKLFLDVRAGRSVLPFPCLEADFPRTPA